METYLICLAVALIGGLMLSRLAKLLNLPAVTAYLVAGLLLGPFALGALKIPGMGFNSPEQVENLNILTQTALGFIAFTIGNEFRMRQLKSTGKRAITIGILQAVLTTAVVDMVLIAVHLLFPNVLSLSAAITLGAIAAATAPAATLMVVRQYKADGPLTRLLMLVVAIDDAVGLLLFSASFGIATALANGSVNFLGIVVEPILEITLSLVLGSIMGWLLNWVEQFFHSRSKRMAVSVAFVLLTVGLSMLKFQIGPLHCGFSLLLVCMMTGTVFCNICSTSDELMNRIESWVVPINILFFVISGAELDLNVLLQPVTLIIGITYILARSAGKCFGTNLSCRLTHCPKLITDHLGTTLLPQAGVALGMALTATSLPDGATVRNVVLFAVLVYELVGPAMTKRALTAAGEIDPDGRSSARIHNKPSATSE
ncbi:MAG: cation:proton antiporter [Oscillospiraceae bacterium]|nr:cation:proton antiporter [Oscillospiraceae bacterium]MBQ9838512.1 cation:proton antiporter [Oscillospiraceae bacterium]